MKVLFAIWRRHLLPNRGLGDVGAPVSAVNKVGSTVILPRFSTIPEALNRQIKPVPNLKVDYNMPAVLWAGE